MRGAVMQDSLPDDDWPADGGFIRRFLRLAGPYWTSEQKWKAWGLTAGVVLLTVGQVVSPVLLNLWSEKLFDSLEQHEMDRFLLLVGILGLIILANLVVTTAHLAVKRKLMIGWRTWLIRRVVDEWMADGRHFQVSHLPGEHDNPDGRIAEDIRIATEYALTLAHSLFYCLLLLVSFTEILWSLSGPPDITFFGISFFLPGHLVWVALVYAAIGTSVALWLGRPLVHAVNLRQTFEANFRFGLVRARENSEAIALIRGEADERRRFFDLVAGVAKGWARQTAALVQITMFTSSWSVLSTAFPILVAAPRYISGAITLGVLMQTAQAFQQMEGALSWPIDNLGLSAEWKASVERILGLHAALERLTEETAEEDDRRISIVRADRPVLAFHNLSVHDPDGRVVISDFSGEISVGERVLISGDPGAAVKLFKVVAELWPWGSGRVEMPKDATIFFMPQRPYLPVGSLRSAISYPAAPSQFTETEMTAAIESVGLDHLIPRFEESQSWEKVLTAGDQQRLGFARLLLHRPNWIFLQEATDALDPESEEAMVRMVQAEFPEATFLTVGYHAALEAYHQRKLVLLRAPDGLVLIADRRKFSRPSRSKVGPGRFYSQLLKLLTKTDEEPA
jgi:vitamin B12/bleomycin/antimicrobial peptide transport system ATP-binding/permease protein